MLQPLLVAVLVALDVAAPPPASPPVDKPEAVTIRLEGGYFDEEDEVRLRGVDQRYVDELNRDVPATAVLELSKQLTSPPITSFDVRATGISVEAVRQRAEQLMAARNLVPAKRRELRARLRDLKSIESVIAGHFKVRQGHVDDGVRGTIVVRFGSREVTATTNFDNWFALPWTVDRKSTWNARIAELVAELIPDRFFFNRSRPLLSMTRFVDIVAKDVMSRADAGTLPEPPP